MQSPEQLERDLAQQFEQTAHQPTSQDLAVMARYAATVPSTRRASGWALKGWALAAAAAVASIAVVIQVWPTPAAPPSPTLSSSAAQFAVADNTQLDSPELSEDDNIDGWFEDGDPSGLGLLHASDDSTDLDALAASYEELF